MAELFKNNDDCEFFQGIIEPAKNKINGEQLLNMLSGIEESQMMGELIYDYALDWGGFDIDKDFFIANSKPILAAMQSAGCMPTYITLIRALLGANTEVLFTQSAGKLNVSIREEVKPSGELGGSVATSYGAIDGAKMQPETGGEVGLLLIKTETNHTVIETLKVLEIIKPKGIFTNFEIIS